MRIWRAHVDSPNFSFEAYALEKQGAVDCLVDGLRKHARQRAATNSWVADAISDIIVVPYALGPAYCDGIAIE